MNILLDIFIMIKETPYHIIAGRDPLIERLIGGGAGRNSGLVITRSLDYSAKLGGDISIEWNG